MIVDEEEDEMKRKVLVIEDEFDGKMKRRNNVLF